MAARTTIGKRSAREKAFPVRLVGPIEHFAAELSAASPEVAEIIAIVERACPGATASILASGEAEGLLIRARALDTHPSSSTDPLIDRFVDHILETADTTKDLIALSATCPRGRDRDVLPLMREYVARAADAGDSAWLVRDLRRKKKIGGEHAYGIVSCSDPATAVDSWIDLSGADPKCVRHTDVRGWDAFVESADADDLRLNLAGNRERHGVISYALKPLPRGIARDLDRDVAVSGFLEGAWWAARGLDAGSVAPPSRERFRTMVQSVPRGCLVCGAPFPKTKRSHADYCSPRCRKRQWRAKGARA